MTRLRDEFHGGCLVVAHRGASAAEPENTLAAFEAALRAGADVVELDVRLTADRVPVVLHDPDVGTTTDGSGLVHELTLTEVKRLDAGRGMGRHEVPTLAEALSLVGELGGAVDLEIKNLPGEAAFDSPREAILEAALRTLDDLAFGGHVLISSFNWLTIERSKELAPDIATGFLTVAPIDPHAALVYARQHGHDFILPHVMAVMAAGEDLVREAHAVDVGVGTWVADDEELLRTLFGWGVDAVATNDPTVALDVRRRTAAAQ